jgi:hypothetical protein
MATEGLKMLIISENGAIQPCQMPEKKPAGLMGEKYPFPGKQLVTTSKRARIINANWYLFRFMMLWFFDLSKIASNSSKNPVQPKISKEFSPPHPLDDIKFLSYIQVYGN